MPDQMLEDGATESNEALVSFVRLIYVCALLLPAEPALLEVI
jgi:hypothetical protein